MNPINAAYEVDDTICTNLEWERRTAPATIPEAPVPPPLPTTPNRFADAETPNSTKKELIPTRCIR